MTSYVVFKCIDGSFGGFCLLQNFDPNLFLEAGETSEVFEGPDPDGTDECFEAVKSLAKQRCSL